jgi:EAL domain-containing protein (putative c-di-GMP-specific phosphodiesterase class I)
MLLMMSRRFCVGSSRTFVRFSWAMSLLWTAFQPIIAWKGRRVFGYEALVRSNEPSMT